MDPQEGGKKELLGLGLYTEWKNELKALPFPDP